MFRIYLLKAKLVMRQGSLAIFTKHLINKIERGLG